MKTLSTKLKLALAAGAFLASTGAASATTNLSLDGFCDQFGITQSKDSLGHKIFAALNETNGSSCTPDVMTGFVVKIQGYATKWVYVGGPRFSDGTGWGFIFSYPFVTGGSWALYNTQDGVTISTVVTGTYTLTGPNGNSSTGGAPAGTRPGPIRNDVPTPEQLRR